MHSKAPFSLPLPSLSIVENLKSRIKESDDLHHRRCAAAHELLRALMGAAHFRAPAAAKMKKLEIALRSLYFLIPLTRAEALVLISNDNEVCVSVYKQVVMDGIKYLTGRRVSSWACVGDALPVFD